MIFLLQVTIKEDYKHKEKSKIILPFDKLINNNNNEQQFRTLKKIKMNPIKLFLMKNSIKIKTIFNNEK